MMNKFVIAIFALCIGQLTVAENCRDACPRIYSPVCGVDNTGNMKTFANKCIFESEDCNNRAAGWRVLKNNECDEPTPKCNEICPRIYSPVCAMDNFGNRETFPNKCVFESEDCNNRGAGWKIIAEETCTPVQVKAVQNCPLVCPLNLAPVCGVDNFGNKRTFSNKCEFESMDCNNRAAGWRILAEDSCEIKVDAVENCPKICPLNLAPVCGVDNFGNRKTFSNKCIFQSEDCNNRAAGWRMVAENECEQLADEVCKENCPRMYSPVCGVDNFGNRKTFANKCIFEAEDCNNRGAGWRVISEKQCIESRVAKPDCPLICPMNYAPVCGMDNFGNQKTFGNKCSFDHETCNNRAAGWRIIQEDECKPFIQKLSQINCQSMCTDDLKPVCAMDNTGRQQEFDNMCMFYNNECENRGAGWRVIAESPCQVSQEKPVTADPKNPCAEDCTAQYEPVCAGDQFGNQQTFSNLCVLESMQCVNHISQWAFKYDGECRKSFRSSECKSACTDDLKPVCAMDNTGNLQEFDNLCHFENTECQNRAAGWRLLAERPCEK